MIKIQWLASIWRQNDQNVELRRKTFKTKLNYKSDQNPMTCIDLTSKRSKCWVTSQNIQNKGKLQKWSKSNDLHRLDVQTIKTKWSKSNDLHGFDVKTIKNVELRLKTILNYKSHQTTKVIKIQWLASIWRQNDQNVELRRKTFKTKLNYKSDQNPMTCIDLTSKRSKCWVTSQNIQNKGKLQKWSKSNDLHRLDVQTIKTKLNYKSHQNPVCSKSNDLHRFDVKTIKMLSYVAKHSKQSYTTKVIKIQWLASIWRQNDQNVELRRKTFKTKVNYKSHQNPMTCIDWMSKRSKQS